MSSSAGSRALLAACAAALAACLVAIAAATAATPRPASAVAEAFLREEPSGKRIGHVRSGDAPEQRGVSASASTSGGRGTARAAAEAEDVDIFDGLVTATRVRVLAEADGSGTGTSGSISGLRIDGQPVDPPTERTTYSLAGYGRLVALASGRTGILGLRARLTKPYKGHQAGDVVTVAYASARARDAVQAAPAPRSEPAAPAAKKKRSAKRPRKLTKAELRERRRHEREADELFARPGYAFPVAGEHNFSNDWGAPRQHTGTHEGTDVFAEAGTPVVAVASGRLYRVGTRQVPGNRLWLRDGAGHRFFYAHLSDFAAAAYNGAEVRAGEVIGYVGSTGDAEQTPPHLHFEVHLPDGTAINPFRFLTRWQDNAVRTKGKDPEARPGALVVLKDFLAEP